MFELSNAGIDSHDVFTRTGKFAGVIASSPRGHYSVYFDSNCVRGSARKFATTLDAVEYIYQRRMKKGWSV
jgi:hypothetical protein